jgi:hypothetical protein
MLRDRRSDVVDGRFNENLIFVKLTNRAFNRSRCRAIDFQFLHDDVTLGRILESYSDFIVRHCTSRDPLVVLCMFTSTYITAGCNSYSFDVDFDPSTIGMVVAS